MKFQVGGPAAAVRRSKSGLSGSETTFDFANIGNETPKFSSQNSAISLVVARLLVGDVVGREAEDREAVVAVAPVEVLEARRTAV